MTLIKEDDHRQDCRKQLFIGKPSSVAFYFMLRKRKFQMRWSAVQNAVHDQAKWQLQTVHRLVINFDPQLDHAWSGFRIVISVEAGKDKPFCHMHKLRPHRADEFR